MAHLRLWLLGGFEAGTASTSPIVFPTKKSKALLAYLAAMPGRRHSREKLASLLWDRSDSQARINLRQTLTRLRKSLSHFHHPCILSEGDTLWVDPASVDIDVQEFEQLCKEGTPRALKQAAALYAGEFLEDFILKESAFEEWLELERTRLRERAVEAMTTLLGHHLGGDEVEGGIAIASRLLSIDPLQEHVHRALIRLYLQQGRRQSALKQYQVCCELLGRELGVAPDAETERLYRQIQEPSATFHSGTTLPVRAIDSDRHCKIRIPVVEQATELQPLTSSLETRCEMGQGDAVHFRVAITCEMSVNSNRLAEGLRNSAMTGFGLILAVLPLALWVAWTQTIFLAVLAVGATAGVLLSMLAGNRKTDTEDQSERPAPKTMEYLSDDLLSELSSFSPRTHQYRRLRDPAFQRKIDRLFH